MTLSASSMRRTTSPIYYEGRGSELLQRLEIGNVTFQPPASRYITAGIPSGNYGIQAITKIGSMRLKTILAQQKGNIVRDNVFTVGDRTLQALDRKIEDYQFEPRRFFFTVDPALFGAAYPNIDILDTRRMAALSASSAGHAAADEDFSLPAPYRRPAAQSERTAVQAHRPKPLASRTGVRVSARGNRLLRRSFAFVDRARPTARPQQRATRRRVPRPHQRARHRVHIDRWHARPRIQCESRAARQSDLGSRCSAGRPGIRSRDPERVPTWRSGPAPAERHAQDRHRRQRGPGKARRRWS